MWCQRMPQQMWCRSVSGIVQHFDDVASLFENGTSRTSQPFRPLLENYHMHATGGTSDVNTVDQAKRYIRMYDKDFVTVTYGEVEVSEANHQRDIISLPKPMSLTSDMKARHASNWLERLPAGSITTWEDLTTRFITQLFPPERTAKLCNDILMFQQHQEESLLEAWTRFKDLIQKVSHHGIDLWLQVQIFYDRIDQENLLRRTLGPTAEGLLRKLSVEKAWATIEMLTQYKDEGWNDPIILKKGSLDYENPNIEHLLGVMEYKINTLMKNAILLMGGSEGIFRVASNEMYQLPPKPSRQEEFEHI
ncbi:zinc finger, CCHC-type containing protein, partial [Tanacetum coccineum]